MNRDRDANEKLELQSADFLFRNFHRRTNDGLTRNSRNTPYILVNQYESRFREGVAQLA